MNAEILIVDDHHHASSLLQFRLEQHGYRVASTQGYQQTMMHLTHHAVDVVLLDFRHPLPQAIELSQLIHSEITRRPAVILLHTDPSPDLRLQALDAGCMDVISKNIEDDHLFARLDLAYRHQTEMTQLTSRANVDLLTNLWNRSYFEEQLWRRIEDARRHQEPLGCLLIDIDHFKNINDAFGHQVGDKVLSDMGHLMGHQLRAADMACRYGGEEFVVLLPRTEIEGVIHVGERILQGIRDWDFEAEDDHFKVTASAGAHTMIPQHQKSHVDAETLVRETDRRLYAAKHAGRDCLIYELDD